MNSQSRVARTILYLLCMQRAAGRTFLLSCQFNLAYQGVVIGVMSSKYLPQTVLTS